MVKMMEIPGKRAEAINRLLSLGSHAVPALVATFDDPRQEVVLMALATVASLGGVAAPALPDLKKLAQGEDKVLARAASWAMHKMRPTGITLLAEYSGGKITRIDADGTVSEVKGLKGPFDVELLPNGNYLVAEFHKNRVCEINLEGKCVWEYPNLNEPLDVDALANGNTLVVERAGKRVIEVSRAGKIVWEFKHEGKRPQDADRLANGNTLICFYTEGLLLEVDPKGKIVWKLTGYEMLSDADRLMNGNTLISTSGEKLVREVDPSGKTILEIKIDDRLSDADRLPNGHTLVATNAAVVEFDALGQECWRRTAKYPGDVNRY